MRRNKRLLCEVYIQPGTTHMSGMNPELKGGDELFEAQKILFQTFMGTARGEKEEVANKEDGNKEEGTQE